MTRRVLVVITSRASYARIRTVLSALKAHPDIDLQLVAGASVLLDKYGTAVAVMEDEGFKIDARVFMVLEGEQPVTMAKTTGLGILELATVFDNLKPDVVVTVADRFETMATAITACYMNIPLAHVQGGELTGSIDEKVRHAVTKLADFHFVSSQEAGQRVMQMGEMPGRVFVTGCPSVDIAAEIAPAVAKLSFDPIQRYGGVGETFPLEKSYLVVLQHPVTTEHSEGRTQVWETLEAINQLEMPTLWFWPNLDGGADRVANGIRAYRETHDLPWVHFFKNMAPEDFLKVLNNCACIVGNSSVAIREASFLGIPAVNIGSRQQGRERGPNVIDVAYHRKEIKQAVMRQVQHGRYPSSTIYGDGQAGRRIAELLATIDLSIEKRFHQISESGQLSQVVSLDGHG